MTRAAAANSRSNIEVQVLGDEVVVTAVPNSLWFITIVPMYQYTQPVQLYFTLYTEKARILAPHFLAF